MSKVGTLPMEANSLADALGVSPMYRQQTNRRWSSAVAEYNLWLGMEGSAKTPSDASKSPGGQTPADSAASSPTYPPQAQATSIPILPGGPGQLLLSPDSLSGTRPLPGHFPSYSNLPLQSSYSSRLGPINNFFVSGGMTPPTRGMISGRGSLCGSNASPAERPGGGSLELEAVAAVHELSFAVSGISVSEMLPRTPELIFVNVTTLEGQAYCLELTAKGWRVTSLRHDCMNGDIAHIDLHTKYFESPYALMDTVSPGYRAKFSEALSYKLSQLSAASPSSGFPGFAPPPPTSSPSLPVGLPPALPGNATAPGQLVHPAHLPADPAPSTPNDKAKLTVDVEGKDGAPVQVAVRHPSGEANQNFPALPTHSPKPHFT